MIWLGMPAGAQLIHIPLWIEVVVFVVLGGIAVWQERHELKRLRREWKEGFEGIYFYKNEEDDDG